jgi:hypothetical protein
MLLCEYAIVPDVFDGSLYDHELVADLHLHYLRETLLSEGLVRDLREGDWSHVIFENRNQYHKRGIELLKKLKTQNRLLISAKELEDNPASYIDWCKEAIASHQKSEVIGIIATNQTASDFSQSEERQIIGIMGRLHNSIWWQERSNSVRLHRTIDDYKKHLKLILRHSNSLMFIDPHLDPNKRHYRHFIQLLEETTQGPKNPQIEIHRVCYEDSGRNRRIHSPSEWERFFRDSIERDLARLGIEIQVFIWNDLHDRYLISNLLGIHMGNGFDVSANPQELTTWSRLSRPAQDNIQLEFDEAANQVHHLHALRGKFVIP